MTINDIVNKDGSLNYGTIGGFKDRLDGHDSSLAYIMQNRIFLEDYQRQSGETNDNGIFTRAFASVTDNTEIIFEKGKIYTVSQGFTLNFNNLKLFGNGATINSISSVATNLFQFGNDSRTTLAQTITINKGSAQFTLSTVNGINVGDLIMLSSASVNGYSDGVYGEVKTIDSVNNIIGLSIPSHKDFTSTTQYVCTSYRNITIKDLTVNASANKVDSVFVFNNVINALVENCNLEGNHGRRGIGFMGINALFQFNTIHGFYDELLIDNRTGYGISGAGHNIKVYKNRINECKHTIACSDRRFYSTNIVYTENYCGGTVNSSLSSIAGVQIVDMHANAEGTIEKNIIYNINQYNPYAMMVRCNGVTVRDNVFYSSATSGQTIKAIAFCEYAGENLKVLDNHFKGYYTHIIVFENTWTTIGKDIYIIGNQTDYGQILFYNTGVANMPPFSNVYIENNTLKIEGVIWIYNTINNGRIRGNLINGANGVWEPCLDLLDSNSNCFIIVENDITNNGGGAECVRFYNNNNIIKHNRFKMVNAGNPVNNYNATTNNLIKDNPYVSSTGALSMYSV